MPFELPLPPVLKNAGWKVKIFDREIREPPHVTIIRRLDRWRIDLRKREFMDRRPDPRDVPGELLQIVYAHWAWICEQWDAMYPTNPVADDEV